MNIQSIEIKYLFNCLSESYFGTLAQCDTCCHKERQIFTFTCFVHACSFAFASLASCISYRNTSHPMPGLSARFDANSLWSESWTCSTNPCVLGCQVLSVIILTSPSPGQSFKVSLITTKFYIGIIGEITRRTTISW